MQLYDDIYVFLLHFSKPVVISEQMIISVTFSNEINEYDISVKTTDTKDFNPYEVKLTITSDVPDDTYA